MFLYFFFCFLFKGQKYRTENERILLQEDVWVLFSKRKLNYVKIITVLCVEGANHYMENVSFCRDIAV